MPIIRKTSFPGPPETALLIPASETSPANP